MSPQRPPARRLVAALAVLLLAPLVLLLGAAPAQAATRVVLLTSSGPSPASLSALKGDLVQFKNNDTVNHQVTSTSANWRYDSGAIAPGRTSKATPVFAAVGTFTYDDDYAGVLGLPMTSQGSVVAQAPAPTPSASPKPSPTRSPAPKPLPSASASASASAKPSPAASASPGPSSSPVVASGGGTAQLPGFLGGVVPSASPGATSGPAPDVAPLPAGATPTTGAAAVPVGDVPDYDDRSAISQPSSHRYGLPAALAVVAITGAASLLVRFLLAQPVAQRRRLEALDRPAVTVEP